MNGEEIGPRWLDRANLLTTTEMTVAFGKTRMTIENWRKQRGLPHFKLGGGPKPHVIFQQSKFKAWAKEWGIPNTL